MIGPLWQFHTPPSAMGVAGREVVDAAGVEVEFADGRRAICGTSGLWNVNFGYGNPVVAAAVARSLTGAHYATLFRYSHRDAVLAAEALLAVPELCGYGSVLFGTSGSATLDMVVKLARQYHVLGGEPQRRIVVSARTSYHGATYGALALTGDDIGQVLYGADLRHVRHVSVQDGRDLLELSRLLGGHLAAIVVEPVAGTGAIPLSDDFLAAAERVRTATGALLVADEVATGYHRTGPFVASSRWAVSPDVLVLSKGLTNGTCAASVALTAPHVVERFDAYDAVFAHGETQAGCPVSCAAIRGTLDYVQTELDRGAVAWLGDRLERGLGELCAEFGLVQRGLGAFRALDFGRERGSCVADVIEQTRLHGGVVHPGPDGVQVIPQLVSSPAEIDRLLEALRCGLASCLAETSLAA